MEHYEALLNRHDKALLKNEELFAIIRALKKAKKTYVCKIKGLNELVEDQAEEIKVLKEENKYLTYYNNLCIEDKKELEKRIDNLNYMYDILEDKNKDLKKFNNYYISQIKAIKRIAEKPLNLCDNLNDIIAICCDMGLEFDDINLGNKGGRNA